MQFIRKAVLAVLCASLFIAPFPAFAQDPEDPYDPYEEPETEYQTTLPEPDPTVPTTVPQGTLTTEQTTAASTTRAPKPVDPPLVRITRETLSKTPKAGETFTLSVVFHNYSGAAALLSGLASFESSEGLVLAENSASKVVPVIESNGVRSVQIRLRVAKDASAAEQSVAVSYAYSYRTPDGLQQAEASDKLLLTVVPAASKTDTEKSTSASATPNIIVSGYSYGSNITAGENFTLQLQFQNTSRKLTAENIVMSVEAGDGLSIVSASNTYYYASLGAGKTKSQSIPMLVAVNADPEGARIDISFRYEYVDNGTRSEASASEKLSIPIYIPDRFTVSAPDMELIGMQNEELSVSLPYINKSRVGVNNVSAQLLYDENAVYCEQPRINLGNFEAGKSGSIDFYFTPLEAGSGTVTVQVTYEDELSREKKLEIKVPFSADEGFVEPGMEEPDGIMEDASASPVWIRFAIPAAVLVILALIVVLIVRKRRKKKASAPSIDFDWGAPQEVETHEDR